MMFFKKKEDKFWEWFNKNENRIYDFELNQNHIFDELHNELRKVDDGLVFEFGPKRNDEKREFAISADGILKFFPSVEKLFEKKPNLLKFDVKKFRQRKGSGFSIRVEDIIIDPKDIKFLIKESDDFKIDIALFLGKSNEINEETRIQIGFLFLDDMLGEYDVSTKVGGIIFKSTDDKLYDSALEFEYLAENFDALFNKLTK